MTHLPSRFDIHAVGRWIRPEPTLNQSITIDASAVRFIDADGLEALRELLVRGRAVDARIEIHNLSAAAELTFGFCGACDLLAVAR